MKTVDHKWKGDHKLNLDTSIAVFVAIKNLFATTDLSLDLRIRMLQFYILSYILLLIGGMGLSLKHRGGQIRRFRIVPPTV